MSARQDPGGESAAPSRRERQAAQTRREIVDAARRLFVANGYAATTISEIAANAGVAVQTIYSSVGSKADLVVALRQVIREGAELPSFDQEMTRVPDGPTLLALGIRVQRTLMERGGDIARLMIETAPSEPEVAEVWRAAMEESRGGVAALTRQLAELGALAEGLSAEDAADVMFTLGHPQTYLLLVDLGWSHDRIERWLVEILTRELLGD